MFDCPPRTKLNKPQSELFCFIFMQKYEKFACTTLRPCFSSSFLTSKNDQKQSFVKNIYDWKLYFGLTVAYTRFLKTLSKLTLSVM